MNESITPTPKDTEAELKKLHAVNAELVEENASLRDQLQTFSEMAAKAEDKFHNEHSKRIEEGNIAAGVQLSLHRKLEAVSSRLEKERISAEQREKRRFASIPKFVLAAAAAFVLLLVPNGLQKLSVIGPQLSFVIQALLMMVMSFCYAIIWDRSRK